MMSIIKEAIDKEGQQLTRMAHSIASYGDAAFELGMTRLAEKLHSNSTWILHSVQALNDAHNKYIDEKIKATQDATSDFMTQLSEGGNNE